MVAGGNPSKILELFLNKEDARYLGEMAGRTGGFSRLRAAVIPSPPGWVGTGPFIVVVHQYQGPESEHDPVYTTIRRRQGDLKLGPEIAEDASPQRISLLTADVHLHPAEHTADFDATVELEAANVRQAPMFRLNDIYKITGPGRVLDATDALPNPKDGDLVRAGSLLIPWTKSPARSYHFSYSGQYDLLSRSVVDHKASLDADRLDPKACYITAHWDPSLGQNPHQTRVRIVGPKGWLLRSEGVSVPADDPMFGSPVIPGPEEQAAAFKCEIPISFPKVLGGDYRLSAELTEDGTTFRFFQLDPVDALKGMEIVQNMASALKDYKKWLGPFPFPSYEAFQGYEYDGMESYSYTIVSPRAFRYASHELGHTYFGGIVPCTYIHDTWNESLTQYIDSVVHLKNADNTLETGLKTLDIDRPLSKISVPWSYGSTSYFRGAYVMKMLESEIGKDNVLEGLRLMVADRRGNETRWGDIRKYMEATSKDPLDWFWAQWVDGSTFPTLAIAGAQTYENNGKYQTLVTVRQSGTRYPFKMKFSLRLNGKSDSVEQFESISNDEQVFIFDTSFSPIAASVNVFPFALARVGGEVRFGRSDNAR